MSDSALPFTLMKDKSLHLTLTQAKETQYTILIQTWMNTSIKGKLNK